MADNTSNYTQPDTSIETTNMHLLFLNAVDTCNLHNFSNVRLPLGISTFVLGFPINVALLWLLMRGEKALSPSDVLGLNLAILNIMSCLSLPLDAYITLTERSGKLLPISEALSILNISGCPLLLTSMCVERYMATAHAVLYLKIGSKWEYRVVCSALIWIITLGLTVITYHIRLPKLALYLSVILDIFLFIMLACLIGIVRVLCRKGPGQRSGSSVKKRALKNTSLMLILTAIIYGPVLGVFPYMLTLSNKKLEVTYTVCLVLNLVHTFPSLGACIGPVFYVSRVKQLVCWKKNAENEHTTQELQHPK